MPNDFLWINLTEGTQTFMLIRKSRINKVIGHYAGAIIVMDNGEEYIIDNPFDDVRINLKEA